MATSNGLPEDQFRKIEQNEIDEMYKSIETYKPLEFPSNGIPPPIFDEPILLGCPEPISRVRRWIINVRHWIKIHFSTDCPKPSFVRRSHGMYNGLPEQKCTSSGSTCRCRR